MCRVRLAPATEDGHVRGVLLLFLLRRILLPIPFVFLLLPYINQLPILTSSPAARYCGQWKGKRRTLHFIGDVLVLTSHFP